MPRFKTHKTRPGRPWYLLPNASRLRNLAARLRLRIEKIRLRKSTQSLLFERLAKTATIALARKELRFQKTAQKSKQTHDLLVFVAQTASAPILTELLHRSKTCKTLEKTTFSRDIRPEKATFRILLPTNSVPIFSRDEYKSSFWRFLN